MVVSFVEVVCFICIESLSRVLGMSELSAP